MAELLEKGRQHHEAEEYLAAAECYRKHILQHPSDAHAHYLYGTSLLQGDCPGQATVFMKQSLRMRPNYIPALSNLGICYRNLGRSQQAEESLKRAIALSTKAVIDDDEDRKALADAFSNLGAVLQTQGRFAEAHKALDEAIEVWPNQAIAHWNRGLVDLSEGNWTEGWEGYDWGYKTGERKKSSHPGRFREWLGEPLRGRTILVWGEQGLGDEIMFASCVDDLARSAQQVIFDCHPRLAPIFMRSFPDVEIVGRRKDLVGRWAIGAGVDYHCPIGSVPRFYRKKDEDFPRRSYLQANSERVAWWKRQIPGPLRIGLSWRGGSGTDGEHHRSLPLRDFSFVRPIEGVSWVSLQYGDQRFTEVEQASAKFGCEVRHHEFALENYEETCNLVASLDLVISVQTAIIHIAGALGTPCWILVPRNRAWRYAPGEKSHWYGSVRQFHQKEMYQWKPVLGRIEKELAKWLSSRQK